MFLNTLQGGIQTFLECSVGECTCPAKDWIAWKIFLICVWNSSFTFILVDLFLKGLFFTIQQFHLYLAHSFGSETPFYGGGLYEQVFSRAVNMLSFAAFDEHLYIYIYIYSLTITVFSVSNHLCIPLCVYYFARYHSPVYHLLRLPLFEVTKFLYITIDLISL